MRKWNSGVVIAVALAAAGCSGSTSPAPVGPAAVDASRSSLAASPDAAVAGESPGWRS